MVFNLLLPKAYLRYTEYIPDGMTNTCKFKTGTGVQPIAHSGYYVKLLRYQDHKTAFWSERHFEF